MTQEHASPHEVFTALDRIFGPLPECCSLTLHIPSFNHSPKLTIVCPVKIDENYTGETEVKRFGVVEIEE